MDSAFREAYKMMNQAVTLDENGNHQEAYKLYISTANYITQILESQLSNYDWCNAKSEKLLGLANMSIEGALRINKLIVKQSFDTSPLQARLSSLLSTEQSNLTKNISTVDQALSTNPLPPYETGANNAETSQTDDDNDDLLSILDSLPDVPYNKPGQKYISPPPFDRASTLPNLKISHSKDLNLPPPSDSSSNDSIQRSSHTLPNRSSQKPRSVSLYSLPSDGSLPNVSQPTSVSSTGNNNSSGVLKVSHLDRAEEQNMMLAGKYKRIAQKRTLNTHDRLAMIRAQEENRMIASQQEKMLHKKCQERKLRLEQEVTQEVTRQDTFGNFEIILYGKKDLMKKLSISVREHDVQHNLYSDTSLDAEKQMEAIIHWCLADRSHPISKIVGDAQFNFYSRLTPLNKKMFLASSQEKLSLLPGVESEAKTITGDLTDFLWNLISVLCNVYRVFHSDEGIHFLKTRLSDLLFQPFLKPLKEVYMFIKHSDLSVFKEYLTLHNKDDIGLFTDIKPKYRLGEFPYQPAIEALKDVLEATSPTKKLLLLLSFTQLISSSIKQFYTDSNTSDDKATTLAAIGADDLVPITIYTITRLNRDDLFTELQLLLDVTPEDDLRGSEGYCLTNVCYSTDIIIQRHKDNHGKI